MTSTRQHAVTSGWYSAAECRLEDLVELCSDPVELADYPHAVAVDKGVVVYDSGVLRSATRTDAGRAAVMSEMADALLHGPGVVAVKRAVSADATTAATTVFREIIEAERAGGIGGGDHFAKPGDNDRVWNALEKLAARAPDVFADYYANDIIDLVSHAWLGPKYQLTSQVNVVNPGGAAQSPHRDYHLGFMPEATAESFPAHQHQMSPLLTLQGAVAHCDMPIATGPTMYLPHSQKYGAGYIAWRRPDFAEYFADHHVQLELELGDAVFFNPALFHGAGTNITTDVERMANLLQVSSAMGRSLEAVDRRAMVRALYPTLLERVRNGADPLAIARVVAASAEGYPFPHDLDRAKPDGESSDRSDADIVHEALAQGRAASEVDARLSTN